MADIDVKLRLSADGSVLVNVVDASQGKLRELGATAQQVGTQGSQGFNVAAQGGANLKAQMTEARNTAVELAAALGGLAAVKGLGSSFIAAADAQGQLDARMRRVTESIIEQEVATARMRDIAHSAYVDVNDVVEIYVRSIEPMRQLGYTSKSTLDLTEALSLSMVVSATAMDRRATAIDAMSKAMQTGVTKTEQFEQILIAAPRFVEALEQALGKTRAELFAMASAGELTTGELAKVSSELEMLRAEVEDMPTTVEDASIRFANEFQKWAGEANNAHGATTLLVDGIDLLADHIDTLMTAAIMGAIAVTGLATAAGAAWTASLYQQAVAAAAASASFTALNAALAILASFSLGYVFGTWLRGFEGVRVAADMLVGKLLVVWEIIKTSGQLAADAVVASWEGALNLIRQGAASLASYTAEVLDVLSYTPTGWAIGADDLAARLRTLQGELAPTESAWDKFTASVGANVAQLLQNSAGIGAIVADLEAGRQAAEASAAAQRLVNEELERGVVTTTSVDAAIAKLAVSLKDQGDKLTEQVATYGKGRAAVLEYAQSLELAKSATIADAAARERYEAGVRATFAPLIDQARALDTITEAHKRNLKAQKDSVVYAEKTAQMLRDVGIAAITDAAARAAAEHAAALEDEAAAAERAGIGAGLIAQRQAAMNAAFAASSKHIKSTEQSLAAYFAKMHAGYDTAIRLAGLSAKQRRIEEAGIRAVAEAQDLLRKMMDEGPQQGLVEDSIRDSAEQAEALLISVEDLDDILRGLGGETQLDKLAREIETVEAALARGSDAFGNAYSPERIAQMHAALGQLRQESLLYATDLVGQGISSLKTMAEEGSDAYKALEVAQAALNLTTAIGAIANQGMGDPYTAFARIAAMAAAMSQLVGSLGSFGSGSWDTAARRQESQGTGTVLGDASADSASIANGVEITADATRELVAINRGMLSALQALQAGIGGASNLLARGAGDVDLPGAGAPQLNTLSQIGLNITNVLLGGLFRGVLEGISRTLLGARSEVTDEGILIMGGILSDMIENISVGAYQEIKSRSWWFGSTRTTEDVVPLGDDIAAQFQLVLDSMADAVRSAAEALGMDMDEVNAAIAAFHIEEIRISTMDLSAEEAQAELEAVFSAIFDDLAGAIVPYIAQFQEVGEGLGETLIRVATSVQVAQESFRQLGLTVGDLDPETMAQVSVGLVDLVGSVEEFITGMQSFVSAFAPEAHQFAIAQDEITRAFEQFGLTLPASREGMWALMQSLDATTEEGREQIAMLLRLSTVADAYYDGLEDQQEQQLAAVTAMVEATRAYQDAVSGLADEIAAGELTEYQGAIREINRWRAEETERLHELARAAGLAGAAEDDLAAVHVLAARRAAEAMARLRAHAEDLVSQLYGTQVDQLDAQIAAIESSTSSFYDAQLSGIDEVGQAAAAMWESQRSAIESIQAWLDSQLLGETSTLTPAERLAEARRQFESLATRAQGGDVDALQQLPQLADLLLREGQGYWASSEPYGELESFVRGVMGQFAGMDIGAQPVGTGTGGGPAQIAVTAELQALYEERDRLLAEQTAAERMALAQELAGVIRDMLASPMDLALGDIAQELQISMTALVADLGVSLDELTSATAGQLADIAEAMGVNLVELAYEVGVELGALADAQSLMNDALEAEIAALPAAQRDELAPLLAAVENAADTAGVEAGIDAMEAAINAMAPALRDQLAPYFEGVDAVDYTQLDALSFIDQHTARAADILDAHTDILERIARSGRSTGLEKGLPSFDVGTGYVPSTGAALIHQGEMIWPAAVSDFFRREGIPISQGSGDSGITAAELRALRDSVTDGLRRVEIAVKSVEGAERDGANKVVQEVRASRDRATIR